MLSTVFSKEKTQSIIDVMPDEMIVWKAAKGKGDMFWPPLWNQNQYNAGMNHATIDRHGEGGFHSLCTKDAVEDYIYLRGSCFGGFIVSLLVKKEWIIGIGHTNVEGLLCIVTSRIIMPTYPNTDITKELSQAPLIEECVEAMELMSV